MAVCISLTPQSLKVHRLPRLLNCSNHPETTGITNKGVPFGPSTTTDHSPPPLSPLTPFPSFLGNDPTDRGRKPLFHRFELPGPILEVGVGAEHLMALVANGGAEVPLSNGPAGGGRGKGDRHRRSKRSRSGRRSADGPLAVSTPFRGRGSGAPIFFFPSFPPPSFCVYLHPRLCANHGRDVSVNQCTSLV